MSGIKENSNDEFLNIKSDVRLDVCGLKCPHPILRSKKALATMQSGQILHVLATDKNTTRDFSLFAKQTHNVILATQEKNGVFEFLIQRK